MRLMILKHDGSSLHSDLAIRQFRLPVGDLSSESKNTKNKTVLKEETNKKKSLIKLGIDVYVSGLIRLTGEI